MKKTEVKSTRWLLIFTPHTIQRSWFRHSGKKCEMLEFKGSKQTPFPPPHSEGEEWKKRKEEKIPNGNHMKNIFGYWGFGGSTTQQTSSRLSTFLPRIHLFTWTYSYLSTHPSHHSLSFYSPFILFQFLPRPSRLQPPFHSHSIHLIFSLSPFSLSKKTKGMSMEVRVWVFIEKHGCGWGGGRGGGALRYG